MFLDESGFLLVPPVRRTWAPRGKTPVLKVAGQWTKVSAISAISVSPQKRRIGLYVRFHISRNIRHPEVLGFLKLLARHLKNGFVLVWDSSAVHKAGAVKRFLRAQRPRIFAYPFPGYAPELNPDEFVWTSLKRSVANGVPKNIDHLRCSLYQSAQKLKASQRLLWSCVKASELPWE